MGFSDLQGDYRSYFGYHHFLTLIFVKAKQQSYSTTNAGAFEIQARLLAHELEHVKQYKAVGNIPTAIVWKYVYEECMANFDSKSNKIEVVAYAAQERPQPFVLSYQVLVRVLSSTCTSAGEIRNCEVLASHNDKRLWGWLS
jgi:hypothetical protein